MSGVFLFVTLLVLPFCLGRNLSSWGLPVFTAILSLWFGFAIVLVLLVLQPRAVIYVMVPSLTSALIGAFVARARPDRDSIER